MTEAARRAAQKITLPYLDDERCDCDDDKALICGPHYEIAADLDAFAAEAVRAEREINDVLREGLGRIRKMVEGGKNDLLAFENVARSTLAKAAALREEPR